MSYELTADNNVRHGIPFLLPNREVNPTWTETFVFKMRDKKTGKVVHQYVPTPKQLDFHESTTINVVIEGSRGTGKSVCLRNDAHIRAMSHPGFVFLIIRRTMPELKKSHLKFITREMHAMGGHFHKTDAIAYYPNGSMGFFGHCETEADMMKLLSSEYDAIYFDEISTFTWSMVTKISSCLRVSETSGLLAITRAGTNPIGEGASDIHRYYISKNVDPEVDPDYNPDEYQAIHTTLDDNPFIDRVQYVKQLSRLPAHVRRAWLDGEWVLEDAYFMDYRPTKDGLPWHCIQEYPQISNRLKEFTGADKPFQWIMVYRALDWGFYPDPAVCLWIAVLPNKRVVVLKEFQWREQTAKNVGKDIKTKSDGMHVVQTFCDPTMFMGSQASDFMSRSEIIEAQGIPLTPMKNDRTAAGYAIHEYLNTVLEDGLPMIQIYQPLCPNLARTIAEMRTDKTNPEKIADGNDHWVIALAYFCMGQIGNSREFVREEVPRWMRRKAGPSKRYKLGS